MEDKNPFVYSSVFRWTLNALNCFKDCKRCIHISYHFVDCIQQKKTKFTMEQPYMLPILCCRYHACWCPGDFRSQGIRRHCIDQKRSSIRRVMVLSVSHSVGLANIVNAITADGLATDGIRVSAAMVLTYWGLVTPFGNIDLGQHWLR